MSNLVDVWDNKEMRKLARALCKAPEVEEQDSGQTVTTTEQFPLKEKQNQRGAGRKATVRVECSPEEMERRLRKFEGVEG